MRNFIILALLGIALATVAIVVRYGWLARENPGEPISGAARAALGPLELSPEDIALIAQRFPQAQETGTGLRYIVKTPGEGFPARAGQQITAHYDGRLLDGTQFDSSYDRGRPLTFVVGRGQVVKGWDEAFLTMKKGERRTLIIPYWLAYGAAGRGPIPPRATLVFEVELLDIQ